MRMELYIKYDWSCDSGIEIPEAHKEALKEDAEERIHEMIKAGFNQGELHTSVRYGKKIVPEEDKEDGLTYSGWWNYSLSDNEE
tara:strand:- start:746 stop:997 length:252 start_codon:yes stop_codon:yes gene_type:complete